MYYALNNLEGGCGGLKQTVLHYLPLSSRKLSFFFQRSYFRFSEDHNLYDSFSFVLDFIVLCFFPDSFSLHL